MTYLEWLFEGLQLDVIEGQRVGQSYLNRVRPKIAHPALFYETDSSKCWAYINEIEEQHKGN